MSLGRSVLALALLTFAVSMAGLASQASAQTGVDNPHSVVLAPPNDPIMAPSLDNSLDFGSLRLGMPLQYRFGFAMYSWLRPVLSRMDARMAPAVWSSRQFAVSAVWARKRF